MSLAIAGALAVPPEAVERIILLASAVRVGNQQVELTNPGWKTLTLWVAVTVNPGVAETISVQLDTRIPSVGGMQIAVSGGPASALSGAPGTMSLGVGGGAAFSWTGASVGAVRETPLPALCLFRVIVSAAGNWTYTLGVDVQRGS